jgi:hypothetical protein
MLPFISFDPMPIKIIRNNQMRLVLFPFRLGPPLALADCASAFLFDWEPEGSFEFNAFPLGAGGGSRPGKLVPFADVAARAAMLLTAILLALTLDAVVSARGLRVAMGGAKIGQWGTWRGVGKA